MPTVSRIYLPAEEASYDRFAGAYVIQRHFQVDLDPEAAVQLAHAAPPSGWPENFTITHPVGETATVTMRDVARDIVRHADARSLVKVSYEGHVLGVVHDEFDGSARGELLAHSFDQDGAGHPLGIGPNSEGVTRFVPALVWRIVENFGGVWADKVQRILDLTGAVNESAWVDPSENLGQQWPVGSWLYLGCQVSPNRDGSYTLLHQLGYDVYGQEHKHVWRHYRDEPVEVTIGGQTVQRVRRVFGDTVASRIYPIAGSETEYTFAELFEAT